LVAFAATFTLVTVIGFLKMSIFQQDYLLEDELPVLVQSAAKHNVHGFDLKAAGASTKESHPRATVEKNDRHVTAAAPTQEETPLISVLAPLYDCSMFVEHLMKTLANQTYPRLEILVSIELSNDADETEAMLKRFQSENPSIDVQIYRQPHLLHYATNVNWLLSRASGDFYAVMPCDDTLPPNYYEELARCLEVNPQAVNCYPFVLTTVEGKDEPPREIREKSAIGPQHERVEEVIKGDYWIPFRGVVRRPVHGSIRQFFLPRLHKSYYASDTVLIVKEAIAGDLIEADVPYYKLLRAKSVHLSQFQNATVLSLEDLKLGAIDTYTRKYNLAHSYASSTQKLTNLCKEKMLDYLKFLLRGMRRIRDPLVVQQHITEVTNEFERRIRQPKRVAVLGAGIQGCLMALMFRKHGYDVTLIDKSSDVMNRASRFGAGRIHLGLEYSNDPSMSSAEYMMEGSLRFSSYIDYLVDRKLDWSELKSGRLMCLLPYDSLITPRQFEEYGKKLEDMYERRLSRDPELSYLGERPPKILLDRTQVPEAVNFSYIQAAYDSAEVCVHSRKLKAILREALYDQSVNVVFNRTVLRVKRNDASKDRLGRLRVVSSIGEHDYDAVVNCLWEGRAAIDRNMGVNRAKDESYRLKATVRLPNLKLHDDIPSLSMMNGPFGDFVRYGPDEPVYFAWHPISIYVITQNETVMQQFERQASSDFSMEFKKHMVEGHREAFKMLFPRYDSSFFDSAVLGAGYVVAPGKTDIDDPKSRLHQRDECPSAIVDGYISVKTQKFTTAPYNTYLLEQELFKDSLVVDKRGSFCLT
jgi:glycosyltransferase involved in cell wall biosynthesis